MHTSVSVHYARIVRVDGPDHFVKFHLTVDLQEKTKILTVSRGSLLGPLFFLFSLFLFGDICLKAWGMTQRVVALSSGEAEYYAAVKEQARASVSWQVR